MDQGNHATSILPLHRASFTNPSPVWRGFLDMCINTLCYRVRQKRHQDTNRYSKDTLFYESLAPRGIASATHDVDAMETRYPVDAYFRLEILSYLHTDFYTQFFVWNPVISFLFVRSVVRRSRWHCPILSHTGVVPPTRESTYQPFNVRLQLTTLQRLGIQIRAHR